MADRSVAIKLTANVQGLVAGLKTGQQALTDFGAKGLDAIGKNEKSINTLSNTAGVLGVAMVGAATLAVRAFADFDQAMSSVQASTMESADNMALLRDAALEAGARTAFSATEAAGAVEELAKAGIATTDILEGGLDGALDLAAAGGLAVADAAEIAASAMTQFGLSGSDVTHVADLLAAGAGKAQGSVTDMGAALNQAGLVSAQMGLSVEETVGSLTAFASAGLTGSDAGTSFRSMLLRLANPTKESAELMAELGINAYDAGGQFVGMEALAGQLQSRLGGLSQEQRNAALAQIFGQDAIRTSAILYEQGAEGVREWTAAVDEQGYAAEVAATRLDNLSGDLEQLSGAFETMLIGLGEGANGPLRSLVQSATDAVNSFGELSPVVQGATLAIVGGGGLVALGLAGLGKLAIGVNDTITALKEMGVISTATGGKITALAGNLAKVAGVAAGVAATAAATGMLVEWLTTGEGALGANELERALRRVVDTGGDLSQVDAAFQNTGKFLGMARTQTDDLAMAFGQLANPSVTDRIAGFFDIFPGVTGYMEILEDRATQVDAALSGMVSAGDADGVLEFQDALVRAGFSADEINRLLPDTKDALIGAEDAAKDAAGGQDEFGAATGAASDAVAEQTDRLQENLDKQREASGVVLSVRDAQVQFESALDGVSTSIEQQITDLAAQYEAQGLGAEAARARAEAEVAVADKLDITTDAGRRNRTALDDVAESGWDLIDSMKANGSTQEDLQGTMQATRDRFIEAAGAMGLSADEANALADQLGLIPTSVYATVEVETSAAQGRIDAWMERNRNRKLTVEVEAVGSGTAVYRTAGGTRFEASGGYISGPGTGTSDSIPARLSNGEYVVNAAATSKYGKPFFDSLNAQRFATGGMAGAAAAASGGGGGGFPSTITLVDADGSILTRARVIAQGEAVHAVRLSTSGRAR